MNQKDMVDRCKSIGLNVTAPLIYRQGKKYGFLVRNNKRNCRERYNVDEEKFNEWISNFKVDDSYIALGEACRVYNISYAALKYQLNRNNCEIKKLGIIKGGLLYAKRTDVERVISSYCRRVKK